MDTKLRPAMSMYASKADFEAAMETWLESETDDDYCEGDSTPGILYDLVNTNLKDETWSGN